MFDLAWSEIALIGVVALIAIGPKDLPIAIKAVAETLKKGRRMASEFQGHVDEMVREANLHEVRDQINELRTMDVKGRILNAVDGDGTMRRTINDDPLKLDAFASHRPGAAPPETPPETPATTPATTPTLAEPAATVPGDTASAIPAPPLPESAPRSFPEAAPASPPVVAQRDLAAEPLPART